MANRANRLSIGARIFLVAGDDENFLSPLANLERWVEGFQLVDMYRNEHEDPMTDGEDDMTDNTE
jgi:hypothetical protein